MENVWYNKKRIHKTLNLGHFDDMKPAMISHKFVYPRVFSIHQITIMTFLNKFESRETRWNILKYGGNFETKVKVNDEICNFAFSMG